MNSEPGLQETEPEFGFIEGIHPTEVADHFEASRKCDGCSELAEKLVQHGVASLLDALQ